MARFKPGLQRSERHAGNFLKTRLGRSSCKRARLIWLYLTWKKSAWRFIF
jgi:hypothetical protein